jgi:hypothetical protein
MSTINLKLAASAGVRRLTLPTPLSYLQLLDHITTLYRLHQPTGLGITYVDEDGDTIVITSDAELDEAIRVLRSDDKAVVRLSVAWTTSDPTPQQEPVDHPVQQEAPPSPPLPPAPTWNELATDATALAKDAVFMLKESPLAERATTLGVDAGKRLRNDAQLWRTVYAPKMAFCVRSLFRILFLTMFLSFIGFPCRWLAFPLLAIVFFVSKRRRHTSRFWAKVDDNAGAVALFGVLAFFFLPRKLWCFLFLILVAKAHRKYKRAFGCGKEARERRPWGFFCGQQQRPGCSYH